MAVVTFPIMENTVWSFVFVALGACFVGRLHIPIGSALTSSIAKRSVAQHSMASHGIAWPCAMLCQALTNCCRGPESHPPRINGSYQFIMWWSGLRGGVAFALASMVYGKGYFKASHSIA